MRANRSAITAVTRISRETARAKRFTPDTGTSEALGGPVTTTTAGSSSLSRPRGLNNSENL